MSREKRNSFGSLETGEGCSAKKDPSKARSKKALSAEPFATSGLSDTGSVGSQGKKKSKFSFWSNLFKSKIPEQNEQAGFESCSSFESVNSIATTNSFSFVSPQKRRGKGLKEKKNGNDAEKQNKVTKLPNVPMTVGSTGGSGRAGTLTRIGLRMGFKKKYNLQSCESLEHIGRTASIPRRQGKLLQRRSNPPPNANFLLQSDFEFQLSQCDIGQGETDLADLPVERTGDFPRIDYNSTTVSNPGVETRGLCSVNLEQVSVTNITLPIEAEADSPTNWGTSTQRKRRAPLPPSKAGPSSAMISPCNQVMLLGDEDRIVGGSTNVELKSVRKLPDQDEVRAEGGEGTRGSSALILRARNQSGELSIGRRPCSCNVNSIFVHHSRYNQLTRRGGGSCESSSCIYGTGSRIKGTHVKGKKKAPAPPNPFGNPDGLDDGDKTDGDGGNVEVGKSQQLRNGSGDKENSYASSESSSNKGKAGHKDLKKVNSEEPMILNKVEISSLSNLPGPSNYISPSSQANSKSNESSRKSITASVPVPCNVPLVVSQENSSKPTQAMQQRSSTASSRSTQASFEESLTSVVSVQSQAAGVSGSKMKKADTRTATNSSLNAGQSRLSTCQSSTAAPITAATSSTTATVAVGSAKNPPQLELQETGRNVAQAPVAIIDNPDREQEDRDAEIAQNLLNDRHEQELISTQNRQSLQFPPAETPTESSPNQTSLVEDQGASTRTASSLNKVSTSPSKPKLFSKFRRSQSTEKASSPGPNDKNSSDKPVITTPVKGIAKSGETNALNTNANQPKKAQLVKGKKESDNKSLMLFFTNNKGAKKTSSSCITSGAVASTSTSSSSFGSSTEPNGVDLANASLKLSPEPPSSPESIHQSSSSSPQPKVTPRPWYKRSISKDKHLLTTGSGSSNSSGSIIGSSSKDSKLSPKKPHITMTKFSDLDREAHRIVEENKRKSAEIQFNKNARELITMFNESFGPIPDEDGDFNEVNSGILNPLDLSTDVQPSLPNVTITNRPFESSYSNKHAAKPVGNNPASNFRITKPLSTSYDDHKKLAVVQPQSKQPVTSTSSGNAAPSTVSVSNTPMSPLTASNSNNESERRSLIPPVLSIPISSGLNPSQSVLPTSSSSSLASTFSISNSSPSSKAVISTTQSRMSTTSPAIQSNPANNTAMTNPTLSVVNSVSAISPSQASGQGESTRPEDVQWTCSRCTLKNASWRALCEACFLRKNPKPISSITSIFERVNSNSNKLPTSSETDTNATTTGIKTSQEDRNNVTTAKSTQSAKSGVPPCDNFLGSSQRNLGEKTESIPAESITGSQPPIGDPEVEEIDIKKIRQARLAFFNKGAKICTNTSPQKLNNLASSTELKNENKPTKLQTSTLFNDGDDDFIDSLLKLHKAESASTSLNVTVPSVEELETSSSEVMEDTYECGYNIDPQGDEQPPQNQFPDFNQLVPAVGWNAQPPSQGSLPFRGFRPQLESITEADSNYYSTFEFSKLYENWQLSEQPSFRTDLRNTLSPSPSIIPPSSPRLSQSPVIYATQQPQPQYGHPKTFPCSVSNARPTYPINLNPNPLLWTSGNETHKSPPAMRNAVYLPNEPFILVKDYSNGSPNVDEEVAVVSGGSRGSSQQSQAQYFVGVDGSNYRPFNNPVSLIDSDSSRFQFYGDSSANICTTTGNNISPSTPDREGSPFVSMDGQARGHSRNSAFGYPTNNNNNGSSIHNHNSQSFGSSTQGRQLSYEDYRRLGAIPKGYRQMGHHYPQQQGQYSSGESVTERRWSFNSGESLESGRRRGHGHSSLVRQASNPYESCSPQPEEYTSAENTLAVGKLIRKLEWAIGHGEHRLAATLAHDLALLKVNCVVAKPNRQPFRIRVYVEDRFMQQGPFLIEVTESMLLRDLKMKIESDWGIPSGFQKWILGKRIAEEDGELLSSYEVTDNSMAFLYLVTPQIGQVYREQEEMLYKAKEPTPPPLPSKPKASSPNPVGRFSPVNNNGKNQPVVDQDKIINESKDSANTNERTTTPTLQGCDKPNSDLTRVPTDLNISLYQKPSPPKGVEKGSGTVVQTQVHNYKEKTVVSQPDHAPSPQLDSSRNPSIDSVPSKDKHLPTPSLIVKTPMQGPVVGTATGVPQERLRLGSDTKIVQLVPKSDVGPCSTNGLKLFEKPGTPNNLTSSLSLQQKLANLRQAAEQAFGKSFGQPVQRLGDVKTSPNSNKTTTVTVTKVDPGKSKSVQGQGQQNLKLQTANVNGANINSNSPSISTKSVASVPPVYPSSSSSNASSTGSTGSPKKKRPENGLDKNARRKAHPVATEKATSLQVNISEAESSFKLQNETKSKALPAGPNNNAVPVPIPLVVTRPSTSKPIDDPKLSKSHVISASNSNVLLKTETGEPLNVKKAQSSPTGSHLTNVTAPKALQPEKNLLTPKLPEKALPETLTPSFVVSNETETTVDVRISEPVAKPRTKKGFQHPVEHLPEIAKEIPEKPTLISKDTTGNNKSSVTSFTTANPKQTEAYPGSTNARTPSRETTSPNQSTPSPKLTPGVDGSCQTTLAFPAKKPITRAQNESTEPVPVQRTTSISPSGQIGQLQSENPQKPLDHQVSPSPNSSRVTGVDHGPPDNPKRTLSPGKSPVPSPQSPFPQASAKSPTPTKGQISGIISQSPTPLLRSSPAEVVEFPAAIVKIADSSQLGTQLGPVLRSSPVILTSTSPPKAPAQFLPSLERNSDTSKPKMPPFMRKNSDSSVINLGINPEEMMATPQGATGISRVDEKKEDNVQTYLRMLELMEQQDVIPTTDEIECPVCLLPVPAGLGVTLRDCLHSFCKECLTGAVKYAEESEVKCPFRDNTYSCNSSIQEREIKALVPSEIFENYLTRSVKLAERKMMNTFHCKTNDCTGWCIFEDDVNIFKCPVCLQRNCITCAAIHDTMDCQQYQRELAIAAETDENAKSSRLMLEKMIQRGEALDCPACHVVLLKKWGCDWVRCTYCKTEICWVTKGFRWGPGGKGDNSGGCKCGVNGVRCHPKCTYCH